MNLAFYPILLLINAVLCQETKFAVNYKFNALEFQFPNQQDEQEAFRKGIYSSNGIRNQPLYDIDIQYYSEFRISLK